MLEFGTKPGPGAAPLPFGIEYVALKESLDLTYRNFRSTQAATVERNDDGFELFELVGDDTLKLHFRTAGSADIGLLDHEYVRLLAGHLSIVAQPSGTMKRERVSKYEDGRSLTLTLRRDLAEEIFKGRADLPPTVERYLNRQLGGIEVTSLPLNGLQSSIIEDVVKPVVSGCMAQFMREARALELLCGTASRIGSVDTAHVRQRDRRKAIELREFLEQCEETPSLTELARQFAWNETQMLACFKQVTGTSVFKYRQQFLLERALMQLQSTELSVTEIAFDAGYEYPCNFATAFKRAFGFSPSEARSAGEASH